jgi:hypothetical protein
MIGRAAGILRAACVMTALWAPILLILAEHLGGHGWLPEALAIVFCLSVLAVTLAMSAGGGG